MTVPATDLASLQPGSEVYACAGEKLGEIIQLSGDRFLLATSSRLVWVPYDWITAMHPRTIAVNFTRADVPRFERASSSRWSRRGAA